jgi:hypothetical protein
MPVSSPVSGDTGRHHRPPYPVVPLRASSPSPPCFLLPAPEAAYLPRNAGPAPLLPDFYHTILPIYESTRLRHATPCLRQVEAVLKNPSGIIWEPLCWSASTLRGRSGCVSLPVFSISAVISRRAFRKSCARPQRLEEAFLSRAEDEGAHYIERIDTRSKTMSKEAALLVLLALATPRVKGARESPQRGDPAKTSAGMNSRVITLDGRYCYRLPRVSSISALRRGIFIHVHGS